MTITTRFVQAGGLRVHVREAGHGGGGPVVLLHGFPADSWMWRNQIAELADRWWCIAPDTRGYGLTEKPRIRVTRDLLARDVIDLLDALEIEHAALVGHDWGGIIAAAAAFRYPDRVERLALLDSLCTVRPAKGTHGWWFKTDRVEPFFAAHAREFIGAVFGGRARSYGGPPETPWSHEAQLTGLSPLAGAASPVVSDADVEHYADVLDDPDVWFHAVQYYRNAMPFYRELDDPSASCGKRYEHVSDEVIAAAWDASGGVDTSVDPWFPVFAPEDRHVVYDRPTLFVYSKVMAPHLFVGLAPGQLPADDHFPASNPFTASFHEHFADLTTRAVAGGHFMPEEDPDRVNAGLRAFLDR
jgi:pimeloyl-ACP methyl ester carboxylesterase